MNFLIDRIPLWTLLALGISTFKISIYYGYFNVPIVYYLEPSEIILLVLNDTIFVALILMGLSLIYINFFHFFRLDNKQRKNYTKDELISIESRIARIILMLLFLELLFVILFFKYILIVISICVPAFIISILLFDFTSKFKLDDNLNEKYKIVALFSFLIGATCFANYFELRLIELKGGQKIIIQTNEKTIFCADNLAYIGKTTNFVFIYNKSEKSTEIIPAENIKSMKHLK